MLFLAILTAAIVVFLFELAVGRVSLGCMLAAFIGGVGFIGLATKIILGSYTPFFKILGIGVLIMIIFAVVFLGLGRAGGSMCGGLCAGLLFNPKDKRKPEKEHSIAKSHVQFGRYEQAIEEYEKALAEKPADVDVLWQMATLYAYNLKDYDNAAVYLEKIIADEKTVRPKMWTMAIFRAAEIYTKNLGNKERARRILNRVVERYPDSQESMTAKIRLYGPRIDGNPNDKYYEIRIEEETYRDVNQRLLEQWIGHGLVKKQTLIMDTATGKWIDLGSLDEFAPFWPPPTSERGK